MVEISSATEQPPIGDPPRASKSPKLTLKRSARKGTTLTIRGTVDRQATGRVVVTWKARRDRARTTTNARRGSFSAKLHLPRKALRIARASLTLKYTGDALFATQTKRLTLKLR